MAKSHVPLRPYSRVLQRGVIGDNIDGRSRDGRLMRAMEAEITAHIGGNPSIVQRLLIQRIIKIRMQLDLFEAKLARGKSWTAIDSRTYGALHNAMRLTAREIGLQPAAEQPETLADIMARAATTRRGPPRPALARQRGAA